MAPKKKAVKAPASADPAPLFEPTTPPPQPKTVSTGKQSDRVTTDDSRSPKLSPPLKLSPVKTSPGTSMAEMLKSLETAHKHIEALSPGSTKKARVGFDDVAPVPFAVEGRHTGSPLKDKDVTSDAASSTAADSSAAPEPTPKPANKFATHKHYLGPISATPAKMVSVMLKLAGVTSDDVVFDLGCNDGRVPIAAAKEFDATGVGVEIDETAVSKAKRLAAEAGVKNKVDIRQSNAMLVEDLHRATVTFVYLLPKGNKKISKKLMRELSPGSTVMTYVFRLPDEWEDYLETMEAVDSTRDRSTKGVDTSNFNKVFKYKVPVEKPTWCAEKLSIKDRVVAYAERNPVGVAGLVAIVADLGLRLARG